MSIINKGVTKQPLKLIEVPLNKFNEEVIPHHQQIFDQHKALVLKLISSNQTERLHKEIRDNRRAVKQLKDLMYELDTLRAQVEDADLDKFDSKTLSLRKIILNLVTGYTALENTAKSVCFKDQVEEESKENLDPFRGASHIQIQGSLEDVKLKQRQEVLDHVTGIQRDVEDLHEVYTQLNEMVGIQGESVEHVEESIESTNHNVQSGFKQLCKAHKIKAAAYPVTGAFLGGIIGGPIGLVAGLKVGSLTALGCALAGYTGGKIFKKVQDDQVDAVVPDNAGVIADNRQEEKKDI